MAVPSAGWGLARADTLLRPSAGGTAAVPWSVPALEVGRAGSKVCLPFWDHHCVLSSGFQIFSTSELTFFFSYKWAFREII